MKIKVDVSACIAAGQCALTAPDMFDQRDDDGTVVLLSEEPAPAHEHAVREAVSLCPAAAIDLTP
ncbi:ferredoxin [Streptomyces sp. A108]|nr:ferredoxin [Streptomyces sp. A108]MBU6533564.1 ferredoxin [Streptomyces sp. A108]